MAETNLSKLERPLKALANRRRLAMLQYLKRNREASVGEIADAIHLSIKATSKHLGRLVTADILEREQRSLQVYYRISAESPATVKSFLIIL